MEPRDLVKVWDAPDNSKLTAKQWSIRLPIHVAAQINALCSIYPNKTKTDIIGDLLATALTQVIDALPCAKKELIDFDQETGEEWYDEKGGLKAKFYESFRYHLKELE